ncbi:MAG: fumarylacetoacetase [Ignavibacteria bacterium]
MLQSFINISHESHFSIHNLPYGIFSPGEGGEPRVGVAIGDNVIDLSVLEEEGIFDRTLLGKNRVFSAPSLNPFMRKGRGIWKEVRVVLQEILSDVCPVLKDNNALLDSVMYRFDEVNMHMPVAIGDYTDFYSSKEHATNVGIMFRGKENALMPNWVHLPVAYHGRASSIILSGTDIYRPKGQTKTDAEDKPSFGPSKQLDFELEMGYFIGQGSKLGEPIPTSKAYNHIFGMVLVNDWSARDIQRWEYVPLGPFLAKNFATSISPWVVTMDALEPFKTKSPVQNPEPLPYLQSEGDWGYDINLDIFIQTEKQKEPFKISGSNFKYMYWNILQQLAHHTITGCNMNTGDLLASGTISGPAPDSYGSLLELAWKGEKPIKLPSGEERKFLQDGDSLIISGYCKGDGYRVGFGEVTGKILPAK